MAGLLENDKVVARYRPFPPQGHDNTSKFSLKTAELNQEMCPNNSLRYKRVHLSSTDCKVVRIE